eukprot:scaffold297803_cov31-Tisochrysis_lutea.AAC.1
MPPRAGEAAASRAPGVRVEPKCEAACAHIADKAARAPEAGWEARGVRSQLACRVAMHSLPAIVDVERPVAGCSKSATDQCVSGAVVQPLSDAALRVCSAVEAAAHVLGAAEAAPRHPAHRRREREQRRRRRGGG